MVLFEFSAQLFGIPTAQPAQKRPKCRLMMRIVQVRQFVQQNIILQVRRQKNQIDIQNDLSPSTVATAPFGLLAAECNRSEWQAKAVGKVFKPAGKLL